MRVACLGAGQLGRMLALAGYPLGIELEFYDRSADTPGGQVGPIVTGEFDDIRQLKALARRADVVTFDWENVPVTSLRALKGIAPIYPQPSALAVAQDRVLEKKLFTQLGIPTPGFFAVESEADLLAAIQHIGLPGILKTRRMGYDGKGQYRITKRSDVAAALAVLGGQALIYEGFIRFSREVSLIAVRSKTGELAYYPLSENSHHEGILQSTRAPFKAPSLQRLAERYLRTELEHFSYVGVLAIEFFVADGRLIANEMAPRVHNSGHWTIEGAVTSQFENHLRAILGWPLGSTKARGHSAMLNFIGTLPERKGLLAQPGVHLHDYGKREARAGRKLGHATIVADSSLARDRALQTLSRQLTPSTRRRARRP